MVLSGLAKAEDLPDRIVVISDMEIDSGARQGSYWGTSYASEAWSTNNARTTMERVRQQWAAAGLKLPRLIYWNVEARNNTVLDLGPDVSLVSGASATTFEMVMKDTTGIDLMNEKLLSKRYETVK